MSRNRGRGDGGLPPQHQTSSLLVSQSAQFSGPIPPPAVLEKYNEIIPNGAERIMAMAENQSAHREWLEKRVIDGDVASRTRGSWFAFILSLVAIVGGVYLIAQGKSASGLTTIIASLASLAAVFFYSKHEQSKERIAKSTALETRKNQ
jgi:uncharacterized membrane protein